MLNRLKDNPLTDDQIKELRNLDVSDRVTFMREVFWNGIVYDKEYTKVLGLEEYGTTPENMEHFLMGATAMFDYARMLAANHWHGHPEKNELCQMENDFLYDTMDEALSDINPSQMYKWKEISTLQNKIAELELEIQEFKKK